MTSNIIAFEGIDGCGKTTQAKIFLNKLNNKGIKAKLFCQPSNLDTGHAIRLLLKNNKNDKNLYKLFLEDRKNQFEKEIYPFLSKGYYIILDRYYYSTFCYQIKHHTFEKMLKDNEIFPTPKITYILNINEKEAMRRILSTGRELQIFEREWFLKETKTRFLKLKEIFDNIYVLDGNLEKEKIAYYIYKIFIKSLNF